MKEWKITFIDQKGVQESLPLASDQRPTEEEAARLIRSHLFPIMDKVDLNDFQDRTHAPTAKWLDEQSGVRITDISEVA